MNDESSVGEHDPSKPAAVAGASVSFPVEGMSCASCVGRVERALKNTPGVLDARVNLATERATVQTVSSHPSVEVLAHSVARAGYKAGEATVGPPARAHGAKAPRSNPSTPAVAETVTAPVAVANAHTTDVTARGRVVLAIALDVPLMLLAMVPALYFHGSAWIQCLLAGWIMFGPGWQFFSGSFRAARHFTANMDTLIAIGSLSAWGFSLFEMFSHGDHPGAHLYFETAGMIVALVLLGKYLESGARRKAGDAIKALAALRPTTARVVRDGTEAEIQVDLLVQGDLVRVRPFERIPIDGVLTEGETSVDESMITGESLPTVRGTGDPVIGGTLNQHGAFSFNVTHTGNDTRLAQIVRLVDEAWSSKAPVERLVDRVAGVFVPVVVGVSLTTFASWYLLGHLDFDAALLRGISVMVIACPCALGLATPTAIIVGTGRAAQRGILVKDAESLELAHRLSAVVFDKTGTLTVGRPVLTDVIAWRNNDVSRVLQLAAALEQESNHPIARALTTAAEQRKLPLPHPEKATTVPGMGVRGVVDGHRVSVGTIALVAGGKSLLDETERFDIERFARRAHTTAVVLVDDLPIGLVAVSDPVRDTSALAVARLHLMGITAYMLSGDHHETAEAIGEQVGIPSSQVFAPVLPDEKARKVSLLRRAGAVVGMVGDGVNDAPALAAADVGFAMGTGTDVAMEAASVTLMRSDPDAVVDAIEISRRTFQIIRQNLFWALGYNVIAIPIASAGLLMRFGGPMLAAAAMALSSVSVVTNSLRLRRA